MRDRLPDLTAVRAAGEPADSGSGRERWGRWPSQAGEGAEVGGDVGGHGPRVTGGGGCLGQGRGDRRGGVGLGAPTRPGGLAGGVEEQGTGLSHPAAPWWVAVPPSFESLPRRPGGRTCPVLASAQVETEVLRGSF